MGKGPLLYSGPRNQRARGAGNYDGAGASHMSDSSGRKRPTDVTAVVESQTNRATSVAAGVVSGAGWCQPVIETPPSDESASSRTSASWPLPGPWPNSSGPSYLRRCWWLPASGGIQPLQRRCRGVASPLPPADWSRLLLYQHAAIESLGFAEGIAVNIDARALREIQDCQWLP